MLLTMDGTSLAKTFGVALAVGLDVFALSIAIGIAGVAWRERARGGLRARDFGDRLRRAARAGAVTATAIV
jgi:hypothetical protein